MFGRIRVGVSFDAQHGLVVVEMRLPLRAGGYYSVTVATPVQRIRRWLSSLDGPSRRNLAQLLSPSQGEPAVSGDVGFSFGDIARAARNFARMRAVAQALRTARKLARGPLGAVLPPGVPQLIDGIYRARALVVRARGGNEGARRRVARARNNNDPRVQHVFDAQARLFAN